MHMALLTGYFALNHTFNNAIIALMTARLVAGVGASVHH